MSISDEILTRTADAYRKVRNTARYLLANLAGFDPSSDRLAPADMLALDRWVVQRTRTLQQEIIASYESYSFHQVYQGLHHFCVDELSSFYLDVLKDRIYTMPRASRGRRSAQTAMFHVLEALARWMAPILSFTAEEIWRYMPGQRAASVFLETWYSAPVDAEEAMTSDNFWNQVLHVRSEVARELEKARTAGVLGASLEAEVDLYVEAGIGSLLATLGDELRFVLITSEARLHDLATHPTAGVETALPGLRVQVNPSAHAKCGRCWHRRADVGSDPGHPTLCARCVTNLAAGEDRRFA
jgi:isoleucyl-tRNA synthetase